MNERKARESGLRSKAAVVPSPGVPKSAASASIRPVPDLEVNMLSDGTDNKAFAKRFKSSRNPAQSAASWLRETPLGKAARS